MFNVIVVYGFFTGCFGSVIDMKPDPESLRYLYTVQLKCIGGHNITNGEKHNQVFNLLESFYATDIKEK